MRKSFSGMMLAAVVIVAVLFAVTGSMVQAQQQQIPDAPSATRPIPPTFPAGTRPAPQNQPQRDGSSSSGESSSSSSSTDPANSQPATDPSSSSPPPTDVKRMPRPANRSADDDGRDQFKINVAVNFVTVPVNVKDSDGKIVAGLQRRDFSLYEDGVLQPLKLFTSDPFPLSAALIIDQGMSSTAMKKVNDSLPAITGAFGQFDEVALYTYGDSVHKVTDFSAVSDALTGALRKSKRPGQSGGVPMVGGPLAAGPTVNGHPMDPGTPQVRTPIKESRVLNDAILRAAQDLSKHRSDNSTRKIIFIISDGSELGSTASYKDVLKVLLTHEIAVFGIGVDSAAIPGYNAAAKLHLPYTGYGNILPKYVSATGGEYFAEFTRKAIEDTYARVTEGARNQYTLGYSTRATAAGNYRSIEVRVKRPGLRVYAKDGYYPLPPPRTNQ